MLKSSQYFLKNRNKAEKNGIKRKIAEINQLIYTNSIRQK
jgi:hypothetical protein